MVPMVAGGRGIGVISLVSAESGRSFAQADLELAEELGRRAGTAVENARLYRERSHIAATLQRGLLPEELPRDPGAAARVALPPGGRGEPGRRRLLRRVPDRLGLDAAGRRRHRPRRGGRRADRPGAPHAAHRRDAARRAGRRARAAQPGAGPARRADAVHGRARPPARPTRGPPRSSAPAIRSRCSSATGRCAPSGTSARCSAPGPTATGAPIASTCSPATSSCSSATASPTRWASRSASARTACSRRCAACSDAEEAVAAIDAALNAFQRGAPGRRHGGARSGPTHWYLTRVRSTERMGPEGQLRTTRGSMMGMRKRITAALCLGLAAAAAAPAVAGAQASSDVWDSVSSNLPDSRGGTPADIQPERFSAFTLDQSGLEAGLAAAPKAGLNARARDRLGRADAARSARRLPALRGL